MDGAERDAAMGALAKPSKQMFAVGDLVKVTDGDLKNLLGRVQAVSADGKNVTILPKHEKLKEALSFQAELLAKSFQMGDHIKIVGGTRHVGETGMVVRVGGGDDEADGGDKGGKKKASGGAMLTVVTDMTEKEIQVAQAKLEEAQAVAAEFQASL